MSMTNCHLCGVHCEERPLYRDGPKGEIVPWICESCKVERDGEPIERIDIIDIIDAGGQVH